MAKHRPGELRTRESTVPTQSAMRGVTEIGPVVVSGTHVNRPGPYVTNFDVSAAGVGQPLAREIGRLWQAKNNNGRAATAKQHREALNKLLPVLRRHSIQRWNELTVEVLEALERQFQQSKSGYDHSVIVWDYLRSIRENSPNGAMTPAVRRFVQAPVNVAAPRTTPTEALPAAMLRDVLRAAMHDVSQAERRIHDSEWDGVSDPPARALIRRHETMAFFILICMEWSQSPDVIKTLSFDASQPTSVQDWGNGQPRVTVRWFKPRAAGRGSTAIFLADKEWRSGSLLRRLRDATAPTRAVAPESWCQYPWICADERPITNSRSKNSLRATAAVSDRLYSDPDDVNTHINSIFRAQRRSGFLRWCQRRRKPSLSIEIPEQYTRINAPEALYFRAIRPAAKWARYIATGKGLLLSELVDDNTIEVLSAHYLNSQVALRDIAQAWQEVPGLAEEVARGLRPTALDNNGRVVSGPPISRELAQNAMKGELRIGISGCRDVFHSPLPGQQPGRLCQAANRSCFFCPHSVVTPEDIPAMKAHLLLAERAVVSMSPPEWALHWGRTVRWILWILPQMDRGWESLPIGDIESFDLGLEAGPA